MPELPEVEGYLAGLRAHVVPGELKGVRIQSPFLLRTVEPAPAEAVGRSLLRVTAIGKRIALHFDGGPSLVIHPMVAGRLRWKAPGAALPGKAGLAALDFEAGSLVFTEQGSKKRASLHVFPGEREAESLDPGGMHVLGSSLEDFAARLADAPHTVKRALCSPKIFSGIGNAWSDEVLWAAQLSPTAHCKRLDSDKVEALHSAAQEVLGAAVDRHVRAATESFPDKVTAFQPEMAVHGRFREPCRRCEAPIQRITRATGHDFHYCARCQTGGKVLADRALSRLMKDDWPRRIEDLMD